MQSATESVVGERRPSNPLGLRLAELRQRVAQAAERAGRKGSDVRIVAVTKMHGLDTVRAAMAVGLADLGENYVQEAEKKRESLGLEGAGLQWHLIGPLQTNKVRHALKGFSWIHSVDRVALIQELSSRVSVGSKGPSLLLQVNFEEELGGERSKKGFGAGEVEAALERAGEGGLPVRGFMTMPPLFDDAGMTRPYYAKLRELRDRLRDLDYGETVRLDELSMGLSNDFEVAVEEGATMIRVGTFLFGPRERRSDG